jgi:type VI secretion system protein ImpG
VNEDFIRWYSHELDHIREMAAVFAQEHPKIGARLALPTDGKEICPDPFVERLLEGFAYCSARVQYKMEEEFPLFTEALLNAVDGDLLNPSPSCAIVAFQPGLEELDPVNGFTVPARCPLRSRIPRGGTIPCTFETAHEVHLWPLQLTEAEYHIRDLPNLGLPESCEAEAAFRIRLQTPEGTPVQSLGIDELVLHIRGQGDFPGVVYESLLTRVRGCYGTCPGQQAAFLGRESIPEPVGFRPEESLFPVTPRGLHGYRILREFFLFPERLSFVRVQGLRSALAGLKGNEFDLLLPCQQAELSLEGRVDRESFALYCTPIINLYERRCDRILMDGHSAEYHLVADRTRPLEHEIYSVTEVELVDVERDRKRRYAPFYESHAEASTGAYFAVRRRPREETVREQSYQNPRQYPGTEVFLTLSDPEGSTFRREYSQIGAKAFCTNRHLPSYLPLGEGDTDFYLEFGAPVGAVRCLGKPTEPRPPLSAGKVNWKFVNHLSTNFFSFLFENPTEAAGALRQTLELYVPARAHQGHKELGGILALRSTPTIRRVEHGALGAMARGFEVRLLLAERSFAGSSVLFLASVIEQFLHRGVSVNSFVEMVLETDQRGEIVRWPPRSGTRQLL